MRPENSPLQGTAWTPERLANQSGRNKRTIENWLKNQHLPKAGRWNGLEDAFFGSNQKYKTEWRIELRDALARTRRGAKPKARNRKGRGQVAPPEANVSLDLKQLKPMSLERPLLQRIALAHYQKQATRGKDTPQPVTVTLSGIPHPLALLEIPDGIPKALEPIAHLKLKWTDTANTPTALIPNLPNMLRSEGFRCDDDPTYRLMSVCKKPSAKALELTFSNGRYDRFVDTCEALLWEFTNCVNGYYHNTLKGGSDILERSDQLVSGVDDIVAHSVLRQSVDPLDFGCRSCAVGVVALTVLAGARPKMILHRRGGKIAEGLNTIQGVPAGTFQPIMSGDFDRATELNIEFTVIREFAEELLGCAISHDLVTIDHDLDDILKMPEYEPINRLRGFFDKGHAKVYFLGIALDMLNLKPELMTLLVMNVKALARIFPESRFRILDRVTPGANNEGKPFMTDFSYEELQKYVVKRLEERLFSSAAGCIAVTAQHWQSVKAAVDELSN